MTLNRLAPMLLARNLDETIAFYTEGLGFTLESTLEDPPSWCSLRRGEVSLMFVWDKPHDHAPGEEHDHRAPGLTGVLYIYPSDVQTLHDVIPLVLPDPDLAQLRRWWSRWARAYRKADAVVAVSRYTADEGIRLLDLDPSRVHVAHNGIIVLFIDCAHDAYS